MIKTLHTICRRSAIAFFLLVIATFGTHVRAAEVTLTAADAVAIHLPADPTASQQFAAEQLQTYAQRIVGSTWSIRTNDQQSTAYPITLSTSADLTPDAFRLRIEQTGATLIGGNDRGVLYAVYELLEQIGCRFFAPGFEGEIVPSLSTITLRVQDQVHKPWFIHREIDSGASESIDAEELVDWSVKNRLNRRFGLRFGLLRRTYPDQREKWNAWAIRGGDIKWQWICHNFSFMFPRHSGLFESNPEYFALYKNRRVNLGSPDRPGYGGGNLCTTNPDVIRIAADFAIDWFDKNPDGTVVPMWPGDGAIKWCECDTCRALGGINFMYGPEGSMSRRLITFTNAVARLVAEKHPDRLLLLPAYANYLAPQPDMTIEKNVFVQYCYHGDYAHGPLHSPANAESAQQMRAWAKQVPGRFGIWEYFLIGDHTVEQATPVLLPLVYRVRDTVQFLKSIDARYYFTQSTSAYQPFNPLLHHALARYIWNPDLDADALIANFCESSYGDAGSTLTRYYQCLETAVQSSDWQPQLYSDVITPSPQVFTPQVIAKAETLLAEAEAMSLDAPQRKRVAMLRTAHDFTIQHVRTQSAAGLDRATPWRLARHRDHYVINADGDDVDPRRFDEIVQHAIDTGRFDRNFERIIFRSQKRRAPISIVENDRIQVAVIPEIGGRIIRLIDKASGRNYLKESPGANTLDSVGDAYFNYGGYEEYVGKAFAGPGWEQPFTATPGEDEHHRWLKLEAIVGDYRLTRICRIPKAPIAKVEIISQLTNLTDQTQSISLRVHPAFDLGGDSGEHTLHLSTPEKVIRRRIAEEHDGLSVQPDGVWAVTNDDLNIGVLNRFDASQATGYVFNSNTGGYFNFELMGKPVQLEPNGTLVMAHQYLLINDVARQLPAMLAGEEPQPQPIDTVAATNDRAAFTNGLIGKAVSLDETSLVSYPAHYIKANAGTIEGWCKLPIDAADANEAHLIGVGNNNPAWFQTTVHGGKLSVLFKDGRKPYQGEGEFYASLATDVSMWKANEWHHFAVVWGNAGVGRSMMQIYVDGALKAERYNINLGSQFKNDSLAIGRSSSSSTKRMTGLLDEMRISNRPLTAQQISAAYEQVKSGQPLTAGDGTLLLLHMDDSLEASSRTSLPLDDQSVELLVRQIITEVQN